MFALFFVHRPIAAIVISVATVLMGTLALTALPISQYPDVVPPQVVITAFYPGQSGAKVAAEVAQPIEEQVNGVERMIYMESQCTNDGSMRLVVTFEVGTNPDQAQVNVQNRVAVAVPKLPEVTRNIGVVTKKQSSAILLMVSMYSENDETGKPIFSQLDISNYARTQVKDELARIPGVGEVSMFGERERSIRIWLDPQRMADRGLRVEDVTAALKTQNLTVAAGQIGGPPAPAGQAFQYVLSTQGRLPDPAAFEKIIVKAPGNDRVVYLREVVSDFTTLSGEYHRGVELGARNYDTSATLDGRPSIGMPIFQLPGGNAFSTAQQVLKKVEDLEKADSFPKGMKTAVVFNPTVFIEESVNAVVHTLIEAIVLVALVVLLFLQNWRAAVIPMLAVPVALVGTLAVMLLIGYSINNLTLFGLVLAIGIVVDDAIVVVEAVEVHIARGLSPKEATEVAMKEVSGAIIGVSLVLIAVFGPAALIPGITGLFFKQFAVTIAVATMLSLINSLTLSPALCPILLQDHHAPRDPIQKLVGWAIGSWFNRFFDAATRIYGAFVSRLIRISAVVLLVYVGLLALTGFAFSKIPAGFVPLQDQGYLVINVQLPDGATLERTEKVMSRVTDLCLGPVGPDGTRDRSKGVRGVDHITAIAGYSIFATANISSNGGIYVTLSPFEERKGLHADDITREINKRLSTIQEGDARAFGAPPIMGLGSAGGFKMQIQDRKAYGLSALEGMTANLIRQVEADGQKNPGIVGSFSTYHSGAPLLEIDIDKQSCYQKGISDADVKSALQVYLGSLYVNDVTIENRNWQVNVQAAPQFRTRKEDILALKIRALNGEMIPLAVFVRIREIDGPNKVNRYNGYPAADFNGFNIPYFLSSGQAIDKIDRLAKRELPDGMTVEWTDMAYQQLKASDTPVSIPGVFTFRGDTTLLTFVLSTVFAFLVLSFLYESFLLPLAVVLIVPMCLFAAAVGLFATKLDLNVFTQIGLVVLVGLASKNAILIVEFAKQRREEGKARWEAALEAATQRLRPILMTSFAFILGVLPLVIATGAGAEMRRALGTAVFSGMIGVTIFGIFFTPIFYILIQRLNDRGNKSSTPGRGHAPAIATPATTPPAANQSPHATHGNA